MIQTVIIINENVYNFGQLFPTQSQSMFVVLYQLLTTIKVKRVIKDEAKSLKFII